MSSYQYKKSNCGDKTVVRSSYLHTGISYTGKASSLYWIGSHFPICVIISKQWTIPKSYIEFGASINHYNGGDVTMTSWVHLSCSKPTRRSSGLRNGQGNEITVDDEAYIYMNFSKLTPAIQYAWRGNGIRTKSPLYILQVWIGSGSRHDCRAGILRLSLDKWPDMYKHESLKMLLPGYTIR